MKPIELSKIAANAECLEGVDMERVYFYRLKLRAGKAIEPITLLAKNRHGFFYCDDGHHRIIAFILEGWRTIPALIDRERSSPALSWRWPRIAPVNMTRDLLKRSGMIA